MVHKLEKDDVEAWIKEPIWVTYAWEGKYCRRMQISVGVPGFRVTHGNEILYDGPNMADAIEAYNNISKKPDPKEEPKLEN